VRGVRRFRRDEAYKTWNKIMLRIKLITRCGCTKELDWPERPPPPKITVPMRRKPQMVDFSEPFYSNGEYREFRFRSKQLINTDTWLYIYEEE
jgi:hypothetical protein